MSEHVSAFDESGEVDPLSIIVFGEMANEEDHDLLQSIGRGLLDQYGEREVFGHYGYRVSTGTVLFGISEAPDEPGLEACTWFKISDQETEYDEEGTTLFELTLGAGNRIVECRPKPEKLTVDTYQRTTGVLLDVAHNVKLPQQIVDLFSHILLMDETSDDLASDDWMVTLSDNETIKATYQILHEFADEYIDVRVEETEFSTEDQESETAIYSYRHVGNVANLTDDEMMPSLKIVYRDKQTSEEYHYALFPDGEIEYEELDPRHEEGADTMTSSDSVEQEQELDLEVADIMDQLPIYTLSKEACNKLLRKLIHISFNYQKDTPEAD